MSNPVDVLTYLATTQLDLPANQVIGLGTVLDTARFRSLIAEASTLPPTQVTALILGEHGDSMVPIWSAAQAPGCPWRSSPAGTGPWPRRCSRAPGQRRRGDQAEGRAGFAVGLSIRDVVHSVALDAKRILPVSSLVRGRTGSATSVSRFRLSSAAEESRTSLRLPSGPRKSRPCSTRPRSSA